MNKQDISPVYDVIIIGAGPSGSAASKVITDKGYSVLLIEKKKLPRYKICSGIIFIKALEITEKYFGKIPDSVFVTPPYLKGVKMWDSDGKFTDWPFKTDGNGAPNVWRSEYDNWLAQNSGAQIVDQCRAVGFKQPGDKLEVNCLRNNIPVNIKCKYLISAEGSSSTIRARLDPEFETSLDKFFAYQNYHEGSCNLDPLYYHGFLDEAFGNIYAWFNVKDNLLVFGTGIKIGNKIGHYLNTFQRFLEENHDMKLNKMTRKSSCIGYNMCSTNRFFLGKENVLFVGEAAGFLNMFGEGISSALSTGLIAGNAICESFCSGKSAMPIYNDTVQKEIKYTSTSWKLAERMAGRKVI